MKLHFLTLVPLPGADVLLAPPDTAGGDATPAGGSDSQSLDAGDSGDAGDLDDQGGDAGADVGADADDPNAGDREESLEDLLADEDDDTDAQGQTRTEQERIKALATKNRKLRRQLARRAGMLKQLEGVDVNNLMFQARSYAALEAAARQNPRLRALLGGGDDAGDTGSDSARRGRDTTSAPAFDEKALPFDANENDTNRYFANLAREHHDLRQKLDQLVNKLTGFEQRDQQRTESSTRSQWGSVTKAAAERITDPAIRALFNDAMIGAFNNPGVRSRYSAQQIVDHYLKTLKVAPAQAQRASNAARQRIAVRNQTLPRHPANGGTPAGARSQKESMRDVSRRLARSVGR